MATTINIAELRAKLQEVKTGKKAGNNEYLKKFHNIPDWDSTRPARSTTRILPGRVDTATNKTESFFVETYLHKINGKNFHCLRKINQACPICEYIRLLWNSGDPEKIAIAREIKAKKRYYLNVIARERVIQNEQSGEMESKIDDGPLVYSCGVKVFEKILGEMVDPEIGDITDLENGYDFIIKKEQDISGYPGYSASKTAKKSTPAGTKEQVQTWMSNLHDLNSLISYRPAEELAKEIEALKEAKSPSNTTSSAPSTPTTTVVVSSPADEEEAGPDDFMQELEKIKNSGKKS